MTDELKELSKVLIEEMRKEIKIAVKEEVNNSMKEAISIIRDSHNILSSKIDNVQAELKAEIQEVRTELKEVKTDVQEVKSKIDDVSKEITSLKLKNNAVDKTLISHTYDINLLKEAR